MSTNVSQSPYKLLALKVHRHKTSSISRNTPRLEECSTNKFDGAAGQSEIAYVVAQEAAAIALGRAHRSEHVTNTPGKAHHDGKTAGQPKDLVGLTLSGGGIRSAAFSLGVTQALATLSITGKLDYLSTVSGGGFTGAAITSTMVKKRGEFVFAAQTAELGAISPEIADTPQVGQLRNFSNYLIPNGLSDFGSALAIIMRGILANTIVISIPVLLFAAITVAAMSAVPLLRAGLLAETAIPIHVTELISLILIAVCITFSSWALARSLSRQDQPESSRWPRAFLIVAGVSAIFAIQPIAIHAFASVAHGHNGFDHYAIWIESLLAPLLGAVTLFKDKLVPFLERGNVRDTWSTLTQAFAGYLVIWAAAFALPFLLWTFYITLCWWGLREPTAGLVHVCLYIGIALLFSFYALALRPNSNSLHQLYQDRLGAAFLFDPTPNATGSFSPAGRIKISELDPTFAPYHLINAAVNLEGSHYLNKRGRNADFFLFSPLFVGSAATGYMPTRAYEQVSPHLDLACAIAVSGAAVSSNMGAKSIRPLSPTLALLNARLGYWVVNPNRVKSAGDKDGNIKSTAFGGYFSNCLFLFNEMFGRLSEDSANIYLTDGGHIDNLGIYELLRRRCRVIIVVDAEADEDMTFGALMSAERYARIDLGIRISLPWQDIQSTTLLHMGENAGKNKAASGPHVALGTIDYDGTTKGLLLYLKSSLTGDETDYVLDYARRNSSFPHETTGDQFFGEEQFEAYRALGFHIAQRSLAGVDSICVDGCLEAQRVGLSTNSTLNALCGYLGLRTTELVKGTGVEITEGSA